MQGELESGINRLKHKTGVLYLSWLVQNTKYKACIIQLVTADKGSDVSNPELLSSSGSSLDPEIGSVMGWPTAHHHPKYNFYWAVNCYLRLGKGQGKVKWWAGGQVKFRWMSGECQVKSTRRKQQRHSSVVSVENSRIRNVRRQTDTNDDKI